jgi:RNA polymerase sigma factor (TIGR02999 family)
MPERRRYPLCSFRKVEAVPGPTARDAVTAVLGAPDRTGRDALDALLPHLYDELRAMARRKLAGERHRGTLSTTALLHEVYLKLVDETQVPVRNRAYFFGAAARAMRQVLVDAARHRGRIKRGGNLEPLALEDALLAADGVAVEVLDLDGALDDLTQRFPRQSQVVECLFFGGLSVEETALGLDLSPRTVKRDWALARAWLYRRLKGRSR